MRCRSPIEAFEYKTTEGKTAVVFSVVATRGRPYLPISLPCGQCFACRINKSREWALRCMHEGMLHDHNSFITLTYNDTYNPTTLVKQDFTRFMKRLRKELDTDSIRIRYYAVGEYGSLLKRPHYHSIIFGYDFPDKILHSRRRGVTLYRSPLLESLWPFGYSTVGFLSFNSAAYVARYCQKKVNGSLASEHYDGLVPEYSVMSRRPGIAHDWLIENVDSVYPHDNCLGPNGFPVRPPRYYDRIYDIDNHELLEKLKLRRKSKAKLSPEFSPEAMADEELRYSFKRRNLEEASHYSDHTL